MDYCLEYELLDDENHVYKNVSYNELMDLFYNFNTGLVYIGGPWCKNCQAIIRLVNDIAHEKSLSTIYNYDPHFVNVFKEDDDLRDCKTLEVKLNYYYLVEKVGFKSEELVQDTLIPRMHVPFFIAIKNGSCVGYYSDELIYDTFLHHDGSDVDMTSDFSKHISDLIDLL